MSSKYLYYQRKKNGLCPRCGAEVDEKKYTLCSTCRKYTRMWQAKVYLNETEEQRTERVERMRKNTRENYLKRRAEGLCATCGKPSPEHWQCEDCTVKRKLREAK